MIGREVAGWRRGGTFVAWGNGGVATAARDAAARSELSVAPIYRTSMLQAGKPPPHRLVVLACPMLATRKGHIRQESSLVGADGRPAAAGWAGTRRTRRLIRSSGRGSNDMFTGFSNNSVKNREK